MKAATPDTPLKDIEVLEGLQAGPDGVAIRYGFPGTNIAGFVQSNVGHLIEARDLLLSSLSGYPDGPVECSVDGKGATALDGSLDFNVQVGENIATPEKSHVIDAMFKQCIAKLLETAKTGTAPAAP